MVFGSAAEAWGTLTPLMLTEQPRPSSPVIGSALTVVPAGTPRAVGSE